MNQISPEDHAKALQTGIDIPEQRPSFEFPLTAVGISGKTVWIRLPQGVIGFSAAIEVDLPSNSRGIHMSRMEEAISELHDTPFDCATDYARELGRRALLKQSGSRGGVTLSGKIPVRRTTTVSARQSTDSIDLEIRGRFHRANDSFSESVMLGVGVHHITACPCTQAYNEVIFPDLRCPMPTHSQRSFTRLAMETRNGSPGIQDLLTCLENALHVTGDLLKRPDEAEIVMKAHRLPQFAEDAVRETAREAGKLFGGRLPDECRVVIESLSLESIHIHDVHCRLETKLGSLTNEQQ